MAQRVHTHPPYILRVQLPVTAALPPTVRCQRGEKCPLLLCKMVCHCSVYMLRTAVLTNIFYGRCCCCVFWSKNRPYTLLLDVKMRLTWINVPGLKPNGLAKVLGTSPGPGLRSKRHGRPGDAIIQGGWREKRMNTAPWTAVTSRLAPWSPSALRTGQLHPPPPTDPFHVRASLLRLSYLC